MYLVLSDSYLLMCSVLSGDVEKQRDEFSVSSVDDVLIIIKSDYDKAYFVTGTLFFFHFSLLSYQTLLASA